jgi:uncharacterized protein
MKIFKAVVFFLFIAAVISSPVFAEQTVLTVGSGGETGTYFPIIEEINDFCESDTLLVNHYLVDGKSVGGSVDNKSNLLNNKIMAGIIQADVAHLEKMKNAEMTRVIALLPLHEEQVHVIIPRITKVMVQEAKTGTLGFGAQEAVYENQENPISDISHLQDLKIAAWGGSVITAKVIKMMGDISFEIVPVADQKAGMSALNSGEVDAVIAVVGAPAKWVEELPRGQYKLLTVSKAVQDKLGEIYNITSINYDNMDDIGQSIEALGVDSILFTRSYRTPKMLDALSELQNCVREKIYEIQDTPGTHPVWQRIDPSREVKWDKTFKK